MCPLADSGRRAASDLDRRGVVLRMRPLSAAPEGEGEREDVDSTLDLLTLALLPGVHARTARDLAARGGMAEALAAPADHPDLFSEEAQYRLTSGAARRAAAEEQRAGGPARRAASWAGTSPSTRRFFAASTIRPPCSGSRGRWWRTKESARSPSSARARPRRPAGRWPPASPGTSRPGASRSSPGSLAGSTPPPTRVPWPAGAARWPSSDRASTGSTRRRTRASRRAIAEAKGAIVSEFPLGTSPHVPGYFPRRNRIIAGWGRAVVVVRGGAAQRRPHHRAHRARRGARGAGRPRPPRAPEPEGTNQLIRDGAVLVRHARDVADRAGPAALPRGPGRRRGPAPRRPRQGRPKGLDEIRDRSGA